MKDRYKKLRAEAYRASFASEEEFAQEMFRIARTIRNRPPYCGYEEKSEGT